MAFAFNDAFSDLIHTKMLGVKSFLGNLRQLPEIPDAAQSGEVMLTLLDTFTAATPVDGTMLTNDAGQTQVAATLLDNEVTISLLPTQYKSNLTTPANMAIMAAGAADAIVQRVQNLLIAALKTATPGDVNTLTIGQVDFVTDGTAAEAYDNLQELMGIIAFCMSNHSDLLPSDFSLVMAPAAWANLITLKVTGMPAPQYYEMEGLYKFMGIPMWPLAGATNFGGAGLECAFLVNKRNLACTLIKPKIHGDGWIAASDGTYKLIIEAPVCYAMILDDYMGSILNPAS